MFYLTLIMYNSIINLVINYVTYKVKINNYLFINKQKELF